jgi:hypothetical protein
MESQKEQRLKVKLHREKIVTRTMYCEKCAENQMPKVSNIVLVYGDDNHRYYPFTIRKDAPVREYGFTPHIISSPRIDWIEDREIVTFKKCCGMHGCGIEIVFNPNFSQYDYYFLEQNDDWLPAHDFMAMMNYKDDDYYVYPK